jgi:hypothetical protein
VATAPEAAGSDTGTLRSAVLEAPEAGVPEPIGAEARRAGETERESPPHAGG